MFLRTATWWFNLIYTIIHSVHTHMRTNMEASSSNSTTTGDEFRAEEAVGGNAEALQALRELITFPLLYSRQSRKLGLRVHLSLSLSLRDYQLMIV